MKILPAIDIRDGRPVRLLGGLKETETAYGQDAVEMALRWEAEGAEALHVVDLGAAFEEKDNRPVVESILSAVRIPVQVGGGLRSVSEFDRFLELGVARVIFGTAAVENPALVREAIRMASERVMVGVDVRWGNLAVHGWESEASEDPMAFAKSWMDQGVTTFVYTDVLRDGSLVGPNTEAIRSFARGTGARVIAAGGVGSLEDLRRLGELEPDGVEAAIVGRALYEQKFTLPEAMLAGRLGKK